MTHRTTFSKNCPCGKCKERNAFCHSNCEKYAEWKMELDRFTSNAREIKDVMTYDAHAKLHSIRYNKKENIWKK